MPRSPISGLSTSGFRRKVGKTNKTLLVKAEEIHPEMYPGLPQFDPEGWYLGPLPRKVGAPLIGHDGTNFNTAAAAAWPPQLCEWAAKSIISSFNNSASEGKGDASEDITPTAEKVLEMPAEKDVAKQVDPTFPPVRGGRGPARRCNWKGYMVPFHDGGCLPSPGRWDPEHRSLPGGEWEQLRKLRRLLKGGLGAQAVWKRSASLWPQARRAASWSRMKSC